MTAIVYQIRDYQSRKDQERMRQMAAEIMGQIDTGPSEMIPGGGAGIDGLIFESSLGYVAPEKDPA